MGLVRLGSVHHRHYLHHPLHQLYSKDKRNPSKSPLGFLKFGFPPSSPDAPKLGVTLNSKSTEITTLSTKTMVKAIRVHEFGGPEVLFLSSI